MAMATILARRFTLGRLRADSTLASYVGARIYDALDLQNQVYPIVCAYARRVGKPTYGIGAIRVLDFVQVEVIVLYHKTSPAEEAAAEAAAARIDELLSEQSGTQDGHAIQGVQKESEAEKVDSRGGVHLYGLAQTYLLTIDAHPY